MARDLSKIRNIGIAAHIDAGKTTVSERILYYTGKIHKMGEVHEGTAVMDFDEEEQKRGITINSAATTCPWDRNGERYTINLIDTPGHVDFTAEVERSLRVLDGAVAVFDGKEGVEAQSETVWRQATKYNVPRVCFINKMDKVGADFDFSFNSIRERLGAPAVAVQIPIGQSNTFKGMIDLMRGVAMYYNVGDDKDRGKTIIEKPIPAEEKERYDKWRHDLIEKVPETDDHLMEKYLNSQEPTEQELRKALRTATITFKLHPVFMRVGPEIRRRSAVARRRDRLSAGAGGHAADSRARREGSGRRSSSGSPIRMSRSAAWCSRSSTTSTAI